MNKIELKEIGFKSLYEARKFAKFFALLTIYQYHSGCHTKDILIEDLGIAYAEREILKMKLPPSWKRCSSYNGAKRWFIENQRYK